MSVMLKTVRSRLENPSWAKLSNNSLQARRPWIHCLSTATGMIDERARNVAESGGRWEYLWVSAGTCQKKPAGIFIRRYFDPQVKIPADTGLGSWKMAGTCGSHRYLFKILICTFILVFHSNFHSAVIFHMKSHHPVSIFLSGFWFG